MPRAVLLRVGHALLSLFVLLVFTFGIIRLTGDPAYFVLPPEASPQQVEFVRRELGLDRPVFDQFVQYIVGVTQGDLGISFRRASLRTPVLEAIQDRVPATLTMGAAAMVLILAVGIPLGIYAAYWRGGVVDRSARVVAALGQSMPDFWVGLLLILVFAVGFGVLPSGGYGSVEHMILPSITLALGPVAGLTRLLRSSMVEVLGSDYVLFHRMKGMPERAILWKHALRNAGLTTLSYVGVLTAGLFTGSVLVETVFVWPGIGRLFIESIMFRDFTMVQGLILVYASAYIGVNLVVDVLYMILNPRLR